MKKVFLLLLLLLTGASASLSAATPAAPRLSGERRQSDNCIVNEGYMWIQDMTYTDGYRKLWLEGSTEINGRTYTNLHFKAFGSDSVATSEDLIIAYMREEDGKVWTVGNKPVLQSDIFTQQHFGTGILAFDDNREFLAYDFTAPVGSIIQTCEGTDEECPHLSWYQQSRVANTCSVSFGNNSFPGYMVEHVKPYPIGYHRIYRTIGNPKLPLCFPSMEDLIDRGDTWVGRCRVFNAEGDMIFDSFGASYASTPGITSDAADEPAEYFNMQGIKVAQPQAGQLYIRRKGPTAAKVIF